MRGALKMEKMQLKFKNDSKGKMLICPQCLETLTQVDVESFSRCPYCDHKFERSSELEDFILRPVVEHWMEQYMPKQREIGYVAIEQ